jgi:general secretion pathway protein D
LEGLIAQLDHSDTFMQPQRRPLKYVLAQDILPALASSLAQGKYEEDEAKGLASAPGAGNSNPVQDSAASSSAPANGAGSSSTPGTVEAALTDPPQNNVPTMVSIGKTRLLADNLSNSIIVFGTPDAVDRVNTLIDELDRKPLQVYLAAVIGQLTVTEGTEFGIDILQKFQQTGSYGAASGLINTPAGLTAAGVPEPSAVTSAAGLPSRCGSTAPSAAGIEVERGRTFPRMASTWPETW